MLQKTLIEIDGKKYMSPKAAGDLWDMSPQKVAAECKAGRIVGATKDSGGHFIIPIEARKPLDAETIRKVLIALLAMKNKPGTNLLDENGATELHEYLRDIGLVEGQNLRMAVLTNKGMELATTGKLVEVDWPNAAVNVISIIGSLASIWGIILK